MIVNIIRLSILFLLLALPLLSTVYIDVIDYVTTIQAHALGMKELNPVAQEVLNNNDFDTLLYLKAIHLLATIFIYVISLVLIYVGYIAKNVHLELLGFILLGIFFTVYIAGLIVSYLNITGILATCT